MGMTTSGMVARVKVIKMAAQDAPRYMSATLGGDPNVLRGQDIEGVTEKAMELDKGLASEITEASRMSIMKLDSHEHETDLSTLEAAEEKGDKDEDENILDKIPPDEHGSKLTGLIRHYSRPSELVVLTMPKRQIGQEAKAWLTSVEELSTSCKRVIFVHETGREKIQFSSE